MRPVTRLALRFLALTAVRAPRAGRLLRHCRSGHRSGVNISPDSRIATVSSVNRAGRPTVVVRHGSSMLIGPSGMARDLADHPIGPVRITSRSVREFGDGCFRDSMTMRERDGLHRILKLETRAQTG